MRVATAIIVSLLSPGACREQASPPVVENPCAAGEVTAVVENFGRRMKNVQLLAPDTVVIGQLWAVYDSVVAPGLIDLWVMDRASAPGREASSPWPQRIEVLSSTPAGANRCRVEGEIVYASSTGETAERTRVVVEVSDGRIAGYRTSER